MKRAAKRIIYSCCAAAIVVIILLFGATFYLQWYALQASGNERGKNIPTSYDFMLQRYPILQNWLDSLQQTNALRDTFIVAHNDSTLLHALYLYADTTTSKTAVVVHGYTDNAVRMLHIGYLYNHDLHYNVLLPDLRYSGESGGTHIQMGWNDRQDVIQWMDVAHQLFSNDSTTTDMVVHGISMGGATTMCVSGEVLPYYVNCFVDDCGYTSVWDEYARELRQQFGLPTFPLLHLASGMTKWRYGWSFKEASPLEQIKKCQRPMLFIHGANDSFVPTWMGDTLFANKKGIKEYWCVPNTGHAEAYFNYPEEYTRRVQDFVEKYNHTPVENRSSEYDQSIVTKGKVQR